MIDIAKLLGEAKELGASDVHITVGVPPKMRIQGQLKSMDFDRMMPDETEKLLTDIMTEEQKAYLDKNGEVDFSFAIPVLGRFRANVFKQRGSYAAAFRIVLTEVADEDELGLPREITDLSMLKRGLVLVTGPAGSGRTTTLAALIDKINTYREVHVITLEDPIEYLHQHKKAIVNQREIGIDAESYPKALGAALRENPDVIMIGGMRDSETVRLALTAAEAGYLVLSSLHTVGAGNTIQRLVEMFPEGKQLQVRLQLAGVLEAVVSQQLLPAETGKRVPAFEIMRMTPEIRSLIRDGRIYQITGAIQEDNKNGMQTMDEAILELYLRGMISKETVLASAVDVFSIERKLL
ncbi:MAG: PilT/PilU family type 4a pilus ATPase [Lachnospiraceae bacterium]|nr:PilT/PilU family type 4a pilus ATPase [Lachnospiraceae bacterium]